MNSNKLFVGGLPFSVTDDKLQEIFAPHGTVESTRVITDRMSGRSRGFGFVEMSSQFETDEAIQKLNDTELEGRKLAVNEAKPQQSRSGAGGGVRLAYWASGASFGVRRGSAGAVVEVLDRWCRGRCHELSMASGGGRAFG